MTTTTINYILPSGKKTSISVTPTTHTWDGTVYAAVTATVEGVAAVQRTLATPAGLPSWAVSAIGKLPLTAECNASVEAAVAAINAEYAEHNAAKRAHVAELDAVSANSAMISRRMAC